MDYKKVSDVVEIRIKKTLKEIYQVKNKKNGLIEGLRLKNLQKKSLIDDIQKSKSAVGLIQIFEQIKVLQCKNKQTVKEIENLNCQTQEYLQKYKKNEHLERSLKKMINLKDLNQDDESYSIRSLTDLNPSPFLKSDCVNKISREIESSIGNLKLEKSAVKIISHKAITAQEMELTVNLFNKSWGNLQVDIIYDPENIEQIVVRADNLENFNENIKRRIKLALKKTGVKLIIFA